MRFYTEEDVRSFRQIQFNYIQVFETEYTLKIVLNRTEKRNAFTPTMATEIVYALAYAHYQDAVRCVVLAANGPVFCAGADLNAFHDASIDQRNEDLPHPRAEILLGDAFASLHKPCIAQVEGPVLAGGFLLICGCTFVLASEQATFSLPEVKRGIWPMQVMASLLPIIPARKILEMSVTGRVYAAKEALEMGLITQLVPTEEVQEEVNKLVVLICSNAPYAIKMGMQAFHNLSNVAESQQHHFLKNQLDLILQSEDAVEGTSAFKEKRAPVWKGK